MKPTKHTSFIPMTPNVRPKQRLNEVVEIPDKPDDLNVLIHWKDPILAKNYPKGTPRKLTFVCSVEWAWSPMHNRIANYYINPKPWGWAFWDNILDDYTVPWSWYWNFIAYSGKTEPISLIDYAKLVSSTLGHLNCEFEFEPGRLMVGNAGLMVSSVIYLKSVKERNFIVIDGAMNDLIRPAMYDAYHEIIPVKEAKNASRTKFDVVGPICETGDTFARNRYLPLLEEEDLIAFQSCGAYGAVMSSEYNSRPLIPEVLVKGEKFSIIRPRPLITSVISRELIPDWMN